MTQQSVPSKRKRSFRRWLGRQREDLFYLGGCALVLIGTYQLAPVATWFVGGLCCFVWMVLLALGGRS